jgi:hypothetical protein
MFKKPAAILVGLALVVVATRLEASNVAWGAQITNGVGTANGTPLPNGSNDLILLGNFNISNALITANGTNETFLMSHFTIFGSAVIGQGSPNGSGTASDGYWTGVTINSANALSLQNTEIFYWVFNSPSANTATQYGIFTSPTLPSWKFPDDTAIPDTTSTDLNQVAHDLSAILVGSYGTGVSRDGISPLYNLAAVPEPATWLPALLGFGALGVAGVRRRVSRRP